MIKDFFIGFQIAWNMLSIIPLFKIYEFKKGYNRFATMSYPLIGTIFGLIVLFVSYFIDFSSTFERVFLFVLYVFLSGGIHYDGLCDSVDGIYASNVKAMKDPTIGAMGAVWFVLIFVLELFAFVEVDLSLFILVATFSRFVPLIEIRYFKYISNGIAKNQNSEFQQIDFIISIIFIFCISLLSL